MLVAAELARVEAREQAQEYTHAGLLGVARLGREVRRLREGHAAGGSAAGGASCQRLGRENRRRRTIVWSTVQPARPRFSLSAGQPTPSVELV